MAKLVEYSWKNFLEVRNRSFEIPIYQRLYEWTKDNVEKYVEDLYDFTNENIEKDSDDIYEMEFKWSSNSDIKYYVGSLIIYNHNDNLQLIVDGQQRLTTTILILVALLRVFEKHNVKKNKCVKETIETIRNILFDYGFGNTEGKIRLKLNNLNNSRTLEDIIRDNPSKTTKKDNNIAINFEHIQKWIGDKSKSANEDIVKTSYKIYQGFKTTLIPVITVNKSDNPNKVFETINTTGKPLQAADLIKNHIFFYSCTFGDKKTNEWNKKYSNSVEELIGKIEERNLFFRHILTVLDSECELINKDDNRAIFTAFKRWSKKMGFNFNEEKDIDKIINIMSKQAFVFSQIRNFKSNNEKATYFYEVANASGGTYYPWIHHMLLEFVECSNYDSFQLQNEDMIKVFKLVAKYSTYAFVAGSDEKNITRDVPKFYHQYKNDKNLDSHNFKDFEKWFIESKIINKIKSETDVRIQVMSTKVYKKNRTKTKNVLRGIELSITHGEKTEALTKNNWSVEHIMPQNPPVNSVFRKYAESSLNGNTSAEIQEEAINEYYNIYLHVLANLTLAKNATNTRLSNKDFDDKKKDLRKHSSLAINNNICDQYDKWTLNDMRRRSNFLMDNLFKLFA